MKAHWVKQCDSPVSLGKQSKRPGYDDNHGSYLDRAATVVANLRGAGVPLHALKITAEGQPSHPLYLRASLQPSRWL